MASSESASTILQYLPAIYGEDPFVGRFLSAFEKLLLGRSDSVDYVDPLVQKLLPERQRAGHIRGLEETIASISQLFDPYQTPEDFLPWLAQWTAFTLRADLDLKQQREFIARIIQLYHRRGTRRNLQELLQIFVIGLPDIYESSAAEFQVGKHSTVGVDTSVAGAPPHYFRVTLRMSRVTQEVQDRQREIASALIELEKPAHTHYDLDVIFPSMRVGEFSTVGVDTLLGSAT